MIIEQGTWTPTIQDGSLSDSEGQTYTSSTEGSYTRLGDTINFIGFIVVSSLGTLTTTDGTWIAGLPYTSGTGTGGGVVTAASGLNISAGVYLTGIVGNSSTVIQLQKWTLAVGSTGVLISELTGATNLKFHGSYQV